MLSAGTERTGRQHSSLNIPYSISNMERVTAFSALPKKEKNSLLSALFYRFVSSVTMSGIKEENKSIS